MFCFYFQILVDFFLKCAYNKAQAVSYYFVGFGKGPPPYRAVALPRKFSDEGPSSSDLSPSPRPWEPLVCFPLLSFFLFLNIKFMKSSKTVAFWILLLSLGKMSWRFIYVVAWINSLFLFTTESYFPAWMCHSWFIFSPFKSHLGRFQLLATMNKTAIHIHVQVFVWLWVFNSFF